MTTPIQDSTFDLEERLIDYAVGIVRLAGELPETRAGRHICGQMLRSGTSPAPNYGEAQSAESRADFIHKLKLGLKELRETEIWLKMIVRADMLPISGTVSPLLKETDELICILVASIKTTKDNERSSK